MADEDKWQYLLPRGAFIIANTLRWDGREGAVKGQRVLFNGKVYTRYPEATNAKGFTRPSIKYFINTKLRRLFHVDVWEYYYGPVPKGYQIHHKYGVDDNRLEALACLSVADHTRLHQKERHEREPEVCREIYEKGRKKRLLWHSSEKGIEHHSKTGKKAWQKGCMEASVICVDCGEAFTAAINTQRRCEKCRAEHRREQKRFNYRHPGRGRNHAVEGQCIICGKSFVGTHTTKYCEDHKYYWKRPGYKRGG
jgi:predicted Zn-ribbon and HTH transcriptional regulator